ncbi:regulator of chromosome condensation 1/beta-lactamase-inhibitor protein II [Bombardia bombarda]|uniref:Regulator of chromosome condensation 1/beta-lactamase-inhibitor protein II n=1 Tax=Bombardia bombarda TaxID=252184 RepID=A0AA39WHS9_9PEZI|nr:regulator of chromosome condensation 1/beta-lactamase-inhibitor protein II [Bombardia bombarda]
MPPKRATAAATATVTATATRKAAPRKVATASKEEAEPAVPKKTAAAKKVAAPKKTVEKAAAPKKAAATKKTVEKAAPAAKKVAAPKKAAVPKKGAVTKKTAAQTKKALDESDKENVGAKRKRSVEDESGDEEEAVAKAEEDNDVEMEDAKSMSDSPSLKRPNREASVQPVKRRKVAAPKPEVKKPSKLVKGKIINEAPTKVIDIFVFGEGSSGELGLGNMKHDGKKPIDVKRPRINHNLKDVVQVACGGMHVAVLTKDNKILTWGVNDQGALGRDTRWSGGLRDVEDEDSDSEDDEDSGLNPRESTPAEIDTELIPEGTKWVQVVASDSATFALTETGHVYGWGTFRSNEGILGFSKQVLIQNTPTHLPEISKIVQLAAGSNHILALDEKNKIFAWGAGQQAQLARRLLERDDNGALFPTGIGALPGRAKATKITCGSYHCFVLDTKHRVIGWGLNNYAELGVDTEAGTDGGYVMKPQIIDSLKDFSVADIAGGEHHSVACTEDGKLLTWGRIDGHQVGQPTESFNKENTIFDEKEKPRILLVPSVVPDVGDIVSVAAGTDHSFAITKEGKVYSWGFSTNYQTGQGTTEDIQLPTLIDNTAIRGRKIVFAGAGGQYSILGAEVEE